MTGVRKRPSKTRLDAVHAGVKGALQALPVLGGVASELFAAVIAPPLERRQAEWMQHITRRVADLETTHGVKLEDLRENGEFVDVLLQATRVALTTSKQEKREALANAVVNTALPSPIDDALRQMFLRYIDELTVPHIRLLRLFADESSASVGIPFALQQAPLGAIYGLIEEKLPELRGRRTFYQLLWRDLRNRGLVTAENLADVDIDQAFLPRRATDLGEQFLKFISSPP